MKRTIFNQEDKLNERYESNSYYDKVKTYSSDTCYFLDVPYKSKEEAKSNGALWDNEWKKWFTFKTNINLRKKYRLYPKLYIDVPYKLKEEAKEEGALWDNDLKKWYTYNKDGMNTFEFLDDVNDNIDYIVYDDGKIDIPQIQPYKPPYVHHNIKFDSSTGKQFLNGVELEEEEVRYEKNEKGEWDICEEQKRMIERVKELDSMSIESFQREMEKMC